ncbi:MAG: hypothetical protein HKN03_15475 [Acidimicrobiales bacterium]|nr:hypothetical protein [Acidimicrobiales bacterium]
MTFDADWLNAAMVNSADRQPTGLHGSAALLKGKVPLLTVRTEDGRIVGESTGTPECDFPFTQGQIDAFMAGELKLAVAYMRGDLKATGSTAAIIAVIEALDSLSALKPDGL